ncbi:MAG: hypothetical protein JWP87_465 [Labilithrix sp.]|jgi:hypothetical protein|nr:hypothetical protein [Labilithrix sp.]
MRRALVLLMMFAVLGAGFRLLSACLTVTPIIVERDAFGGPDAGCLKCLQGPEACAGLIEDCEGDPRCKPIYACMVRETCLDLLTLDDKIKCGLPCAQDAGIQSASDPVITTYLVGLVACGQEKCAGPCNLSDAGVGL